MLIYFSPVAKKYVEPQLNVAKVIFYYYFYPNFTFKCIFYLFMDNFVDNQLFDSFPNEESCLKHLEMMRWNGIVVSPFSPNSKVYYCADGKYKCRNSGKYFNAKTGTIFHNSRISLQKWFIAIWIMAIEKNAITSVDMAKRLGITQKTAWYMMQRIREYFNLKKTRPHTPKKPTMPPKGNEAPIQNEAAADADRLKMIDWLNMLKK